MLQPVGPQNAPATTTASAAASATVPKAQPAEPVTQPAASTSGATPAISGPSFLGLNQPVTDGAAARGRPSADPKATTSRNLDYLLEDDSAPARGGGGKYALIVVALLLAVGLGYLRWRNQGFGWLGSKKPAAVQSAEGETGSNSSSASPAAPSGDNNSSAANPSTNAASGNSSAASPAGTGAQPADSSSSAGSAPSAAGASAPAAGTAPASTTADSSATPSGNAALPGAQPEAEQPAKNAAPASERTKPAPKAAEVKTAKVSDPVAEAQKYIAGKGVAQNCDRGLRILKPAADHGNAKAMIEMGALYSAGLCTPRDLPTAYHWFALALKKDPNNQSVQTDLEKLWGEMTQPERQLAMRMSQ